MDRWKETVAVVTGASSGIGLATAKALLEVGLIVVGLARRKEKMEKEMKGATNSSNFYARECDFTDENSITDNFKWVRQTFGKLHVLVNNADAIEQSRIEDSPIAELNKVFKVNVLGLLDCTREAISLMKETISEAHIINVNSISGHKEKSSKDGYVYPASKVAIRGLSETLAIELQKSNIRVSTVSPRVVKTELAQSTLEKNPSMPALKTEDLANVIIYILGTPPHVEIVDVILQAK